MSTLAFIDERLDELYDEIKVLQQQRVVEVRAPFERCCNPIAVPPPSTEEVLRVMREAWTAAGRSVRPEAREALQAAIHRRAEKLTA